MDVPCFPGDFKSEPAIDLVSGVLCVEDQEPADEEFKYSGRLTALQMETGKKLWEAPMLKTSSGDVHMSPAIAEKTVYWGGRDGILRALDVQTGREKWKSATFGEMGVHYKILSPTVAWPVVYVTTFDKLFALDAGTGEKRWAVLQWIMRTRRFSLPATRSFFF